MAKLEPYVEKILKKYLPEDILPKDAVWLHKQSGQFIAKHRTLEIIAAKCGIEFNEPKILECDVANGICVISVEGIMYSESWVNSTKKTDEGVPMKHLVRNVRREWSIGEASPKNCMNQYPAAMAEKRAKDRVILKLLGLHGYVYSDQEIDTAPTIGSKIFDRLSADIASCETLEELDTLIKSEMWTVDVEKLADEDASLTKLLRKEWKTHKESLDGNNGKRNYGL